MSNVEINYYGDSKVIKFDDNYSMDIDPRCITIYTPLYYICIKPFYFYMCVRNLNYMGSFKSLDVSNYMGRLVVKLNGNRIYHPSFEIDNGKEINIIHFISKLLGETT